MQQLIKDGSIAGADHEFVDFFLKKSERALETAHGLLRMSQDAKIKEKLQLPHSYDGYM